MIERMAKYFVRVIGVFVVLGPLFAVFPGLVNPFFALGAWMVGAGPAYLAALYYFLITFWWHDSRSPSRPTYRFALFGLLGSGCGMLGVLSYVQLPIPHAQFEQLIFASQIISLSLGGIGGFGSAVFIVLLWGRKKETMPLRLA
jgi:hypothetical protein